MSSVAGWLCLGGTEVVNEERTRAYLRNCLGDSSWQFFDCDCPPLAAHIVEGGCALVLDGTVGTNVSTPDKAAFAIPGDREWRWEGSLDQEATGGNQVFFAQALTAVIDVAFVIRRSPGGFLQLVLSNNGSTTSTSGFGNPAVGDGVKHRVRVTWRQSDGRTQAFLGDPGTDWLLLPQQGSDGTIAIASVFDSSADLSVGALGNATQRAAGTYTYAAMLDGIDGTVLASPDFTAQAPGTTSFADAQGNVWDLNGNAEIECALDAYGSPATDPAPWYSAAHPASEKFFGFIPERSELSVPTSRAVTQRIDGGGVLGPELLLPRNVEFRGWLVAADEEGMRWGIRWMQEVLRGRICAPGCSPGDLSLLTSCADPSYFREMVGAGLVDGPRFDVAVPDGRSSVAVPTQFQLAVEMPYLFHDGDVIADALPIPSPSEESWDELGLDWDDPDTPWDGTILVGPYHCLLIDTPDWFDGSTLELSLSAPAGALSDVRITMAVSLDGTCDEQARHCFDITIPHLPAEGKLTVDGRRRQVRFFNPTRRTEEAGYRVVDWTGAFPWPDLSACSQVCLCIDNSVSAPLPVEVTAVQYQREL